MVGLQPASMSNTPVGVSVTGIGVVADRVPELNFVLVKLYSGVNMTTAMNTLKKRSDVRYVEPNYIQHALTTPNDPGYPKQYGPQKVKADLAWDIYDPQNKVLLAVIDTGVDYKHPDVQNVLAKDGSGNVIGFNAINDTSNAQDDHGHGTHCAGVAAGQTNNGIGIAGIAGWNPKVPAASSFVRVLPVKVLNSGGAGTDVWIGKGMVWAVDHGAKVLSMSIGGSGGKPEEDAAAYAWSKGALVVAAAGNDGSSNKSNPAAYPNVLSVGATDNKDTLANFSNYGDWVFVAAPGVDVYSSVPGNKYEAWSGTSMACPHVAGEAALLLAQNGTLTNAQITKIITENVDPYTPISGHQLKAGAGRINVYKALQAASVSTAVVPQSLTLDKTSTGGGNVVNGTVTLYEKATGIGLTLTLFSFDTNVATVPPTVKVLGGQQSVTFPINTKGVSSPDVVTIMAYNNKGSVIAYLTVVPPAPEKLTFNPDPVRGGNDVTATVSLNGVAPTGGLTVALSSENTKLATVPATVKVPAGAGQVTFPVTTYAVAAQSIAMINAAANGVNVRTGFTIKPSVPDHMTFNPDPVYGGNNTTGTLFLNGAAPAGGFVVNLASDYPNLAQVPSSVTVPAGAKQVTFPVTTNAVLVNSLAVISAGVPGTNIRSVFTLLPAVPLNIVYNPGSVKGGANVTATLQLNGKAPTGGLNVTLTSENTAIAQVPATVKVPAGATQVNFTVMTSKVTTSKTAVIDAKANGVTIKVGFTVTP